MKGSCWDSFVFANNYFWKINVLPSVFQYEASKTSPLFIAFIVPGIGGQQERSRQRIWGRTVGGQGWGIQRVGIWSICRMKRSICWMKRSIGWMVRSIGSMDWSSSALSIGVACMPIAWMVIGSILRSVLTDIVGSIILRLLSCLVGAVSPFHPIFSLSRSSLLPSISLSAPFFLHPETGAIWNNNVLAVSCLQCKTRKVLKLDTDFRWMILDFE